MTDTTQTTQNTTIPAVLVGFEERIYKLLSERQQTMVDTALESLDEDLGVYVTNGVPVNGSRSAIKRRWKQNKGRTPDDMTVFTTTDGADNTWKLAIPQTTADD